MPARRFGQVAGWGIPCRVCTVIDGARASAADGALEQPFVATERPILEVPVLVRLCVCSDSGVDEHAGLVTDGPRVVAGLEVDDVAGADGDLLPVVGFHGHLPGEAEPGVV